MSSVSEVLNRGDRASQPDADTVPTHSLYFVTDENVIEQSDGADWQPYAGGVSTTGSPANGNLCKFSAGSTITNGNLSGAVTTSDTLVTTLASGLSPDVAALLIAGQQLQCFCVRIVNTAGTLQHQIVASANDLVASDYANKITGASATLANTPTVGAGTDFTSGGGIVGENFVLNTAAQTVAAMIAITSVDYYNGNVNLPRVLPKFNSRNVNGTTRIRLELAFYIQQPGTAWTINTTNIPSGTAIVARVLVALA